jgi:hypothetical protein
MRSYMETKLDFTDKEKFMVQYYRNPRLCSLSRHVISALYYLIPSAVCCGISIWQDSAAWAFVAYGLLLVYVCHQLFQAREWAGVMPGLIAKYEAHVKALEKELGERGRTVGPQRLDS